MSTTWKFDGIEKKHDLYEGEDCMKIFCESLRKYVMEIINFEKKKMMPLRNVQQESYKKAKICYIFININTVMIKVIIKLKTIATILLNTEVKFVSFFAIDQTLITIIS